MTGKDFKAIVDRLNPEVWLVTAQAGPRRGGMVATFVNPASIVPDMPRVVIGPAKQHFTHELIEASGSFALHLVGEEHVQRVWDFGTQSGRETDKLAGLPIRTGVTGSPILTDVLAWLDCRVESQLDTGDRTLFLAAVVDGGQLREQPPLRMKRLLQLASPAELRVLKAQLERDIAVDAVAIQAWRRKGQK